MDDKWRGQTPNGQEMDWTAYGDNRPEYTLASNFQTKERYPIFSHLQTTDTSQSSETL